MNLVSILENLDVEKRIAITPEIAKKYISLGFNLSLPKNYGVHLGFSNEEYNNLGINLIDNEVELISVSDIIIQLGLPNKKKLSLLKENQTLIGSLNGILIALLSFVILNVVGLSNYALSLSIAVFGNVLIGNLFGSAIPLILRKIGYDPALASNIFLTLITDIIGFAGFLAIALILI